MNPEETFVELRDGRFKIRVLTAGEGDPVIFLHGVDDGVPEQAAGAVEEDHRVTLAGSEDADLEPAVAQLDEGLFGVCLLYTSDAADE